MTNKILYLLLIMGILLSPSVMADDLLTIYQLAQQNDPTLQVQRQSALATEELTNQVRANFLPKINATQTILEKKYTGDIVPTLLEQDLAVTIPPASVHVLSRTFNLKLTQPVFYYEEWVKFGQATYQVQSARATYAAAEQDLIVRTFDRFFGVLKARDKYHFAVAQRKAFEKFWEETQQRYKAGLIAVTDVQIAKARRDSAVAQEIAAETEVENQKEQLAEITGRCTEVFATLKQDIKLVKPEPAKIEYWVDTSLDKNLSLEASRYLMSAARTGIRVEQGGHMPNLNIIGGVEHDAADLLTSKATISSIGLQIDFPLFSGGSITSKTRQAMHLYEKSSKEYEVLYRQTESTTRQSYRNVITQISQVTALKQAVVSNTQALQATQASFGVGTRTIVDVLDSQSALIKAQEEYAIARYDYILQSIKLKQSAGILSPEDVCHINAWLN